MIFRLNEFLKTYPSGQFKPAPEKKINEVAMKALLIVAELTLAMGVFFLFKERNIIPILPLQNPWLIATACVVIAYVGLSILHKVIEGVAGYYIHKNLDKDQNARAVVNITLIAHDFLICTGIAFMARSLKTCCTFNNPSLPIRGNFSIPLETVIAVTLCASLLLFQKAGPGWSVKGVGGDRASIKAIQGDVAQGIKISAVKEKMNRNLKQSLSDFKTYIAGEGTAELSKDLAQQKKSTTDIKQNDDSDDEFEDTGTEQSSDQD